MPLNIKDPGVHAKARELARLMKANMTAAVSEAIDDKIALITRRHDERSAREATRLSGFIAEAFRASGETSASHAEMYGDDGLPR